MALVDRSGEGVIWIGRQWVRWILWSCGIRVESERNEEGTRSRTGEMLACESGGFYLALEAQVGSSR